MNAAVQATPIRKIWETPGGVHPPDNKAQSLKLPLEKISPPPLVILPLNQHIGAPAEAIVEVGDHVNKGQLIARAKGFVSANVHASVSGEVIAVEERTIAHPSGMKDLCVVIRNDRLEQWCELKAHPNYKRLHPGEIINLIEAAGIVGMGGAGFPTAVKLQPNKSIDTLIINATECEPYITADDSLLQNFPQEIIEAIGLLDFLLDKPKEILIAIEDNKPNAIKIMQEAVKKNDSPRIEVVSLPTKYPSGGEKQLIQMLTGKEIEPGHIPAELGIVCQNVATVVAAHDAVVKGEPLISRITTISGEALEKPQNIIIPIGTPIDFILKQQGVKNEELARLVMGGPMMGFTLTDTEVPVIKTTNCILALSKTESPPPTPAQACIRCGLCAESCPASLLPQQLYWYARAQDHEKLESHNLFDCIECGACSYSCPSHIPLVQYYRAAKSEIRQAEFEKQQSDRARQRFEFHKQRIDAEKEARAEAKRLAAEKAKQRSLEKAKKEAEKESDQTSSKQDESLDKDAPKQNTDQEQAKAKIERSIQSAEDNIQKLKDKLEEAQSQTPDKAPAISAQIKNAEIKLTAQQNKLKALTEENSADKSVSPENQKTSESTSEKGTETETEVGLTTDTITNTSNKKYPVEHNTQPVTANETASKGQIEQWRQKLLEMREKLSRLSEGDSDIKAATALSIQMLENKIASSNVDESIPDKKPPEETPEGESDAVLKAMETALAQKMQQKMDANVEANDSTKVQGNPKASLQDEENK